MSYLRCMWEACTFKIIRKCDTGREEQNLFIGKTKKNENLSSEQVVRPVANEPDSSPLRGEPQKNL